MTNEHQTGKPTDREQGPRQRFRHSRKLGLVRALAINLALIVAPLLIYYVVVTGHSAAYTDERSLRALQEIATQVDNRLDTLENILGSASGQLQQRFQSEWESYWEGYWEAKVESEWDRAKKPDHVGATIYGRHYQSIEKYRKARALPTTTEMQEKYKDFVQRTADAMPRVPVLQMSFQERNRSPCKSHLSVDKGRNPRLKLVDCHATGFDQSTMEICTDSSKSNCDLPVIETSFSQMIGNTRALKEVPVIIVASQSGEVYAQLRRNHAADSSPPAHAEVREEPTVANLREILAAAKNHAIRELSEQDEAGDSAGPKGQESAAVEAGPLGLPVTLDTHVAGTPYRAYVLPHPLKVPVCEEADANPRGAASTHGGKTSERKTNDGQTIEVKTNGVETIEIKANEVKTEDKHRCVDEQAILYLVGLRKSGPVVSATASMSPVVLLGVFVALIAACLLWPFLRHALLEPNDAVTWRQVQMLGIAFIVLAALGVLAARAAVLSHFMNGKMDQAIGTVADEIDRKLAERIGKELAVLRRLEEVAGRLGTDGAECQTGSAQRAVGPPAGPPAGYELYPIAENFFQTDESGSIPKNSRSYYAFSNSWPSVCSPIDLGEREYFSLLKDGHGIRSPKWQDAPVVLQRLFNKSDGDKILQLAVARGDGPDDFQGISALNIGTIGVIHPVLPVGIGYAIFERSTGTVVFHSDDHRSLVENFYAETEHNATLLSAVDARQDGGTRFRGRYRGASTAFVYRPMTYSPWGLAVFYDTSAVSSVLALSVVSALAVTVVTLLIGLALAHAVIRLADRRHSWLWPQWRLRDAYLAATIYLAIVSFCEFHILRLPQSGAWQVAVLLSAPLFVLTACFSALSPGTPEMAVRRPLSFRHGMGITQWSLLLHASLLLTWVLAAMAAGEYGTGVGLVLAFVGWVMVLERGRATESARNRNPWRRELSLWPGSVMPATGRAGYRTRYLTFVVSLALVVAVVPTLAIFDRTFEWYVSSALDLARAETTGQWDARIRKMREDVRSHVQNQDRREKLLLAVPGAAQEIGGFGVTFADAWGYHVDGPGLFGVASHAQCLHPTVAWPIGLWEREMRWDQRLLEHLRLEAVALETNGPAPGAPPPGWACGVRGTLDELMDGSTKPLEAAMWDSGSGLVVVALLMLLLNFSARHVMGMSVPWSGRLGRQSAPVPVPETEGDRAATAPPRRILLLQPSGASLGYLRAQAHGRIQEIDAAADPLGRPETYRERATTWLLRRVEIAILDTDRRVALLSLLEALVRNRNIDVVVIGDVPPVYRIACPQAYPGPSWVDIGDAERLRWIDLFTHFHKVYSVTDLKSVEPPAGGGTMEEVDAGAKGLGEFICRETRALWPCLRPVRAILLGRLRDGAQLTRRDVIEFVALHGEVHYRKAWEYCTRAERLALYHLAQGKLINMSNHRVIEHLLRRGLVVFEPEPRIKSASMAQFILNAELPGRMESWAAEASEGLWQGLRVPFFVALMLVVAWIAYSSGAALQAVMALLGSSLAVVGQAFRLLGSSGFPGDPKEK